MKTRLRWFVAILFFVSLAPAAWAQDSKDAQSEKHPPLTTETRAVRSEPTSTNVYRLLFVLTEWEDGKKLNSREYSMTALESHTSRLRIGTKIPVSISGGPQYQYMDANLNLDCSVHVVDDNVILSSIVDISSFALAEQAETKSSPLIRNQRSQVDAIAALGKPVLLSSIDDPSSKKRYQIEVTVTKLR